MSDPVVLLSTGDVVGPAGGVTDNSMVLFSGTSGKLIKGNNAVVTAAGLALLDDVNAGAQRATLGLGTAATSNVTTSATDTTAGRVLKVGDFGLGGTSTAQMPSIGDANATAATGFYRLESPFTNGPTATTYTIINTQHGSTIQQIALGTTYNPFVYTRAFAASTWSAWVGVVTGANVTTSATDTTAGRLTKVGDFGLGSVATPTIADIDAFSTPSGFYKFTDGAGTKPVGGGAYAYVLINNWNGVTLNQTWIPYGTSQMFVRTATYNNTWGAWREVALTDSPAFTGIPTAPTASVGTNTTQLATTAFVAATAVGIGQTWQTLTASRAANTNYTNTTGRSIVVVVVGVTGNYLATMTVNGIPVGQFTPVQNGSLTTTVTIIVPPGGVYQMTTPAGYSQSWQELR